jgi:outer membrane protein
MSISCQFGRRERDYRKDGLVCHFFRYSGCALLAGIMVLAGTGCATIKRAREAQDAKKAPPGERTVKAAEIGLGSNSVVTVTNATRMALDYRPTLIQARQVLASAKAQEQEAVSAYWPEVNAAVAYSRKTSNSSGQPFSNKSTDALSGSVGFDMMIYDFGKTPALVRQAVENLIVAEETLEAVKSDVVYEVRTAFFDLCRAQELMKEAEDAVMQFEKHLEQARVFFEVGTRIRYDVTKAEVDLGNARLLKIDAANALETTRVALNQSLGLAEDPGFKVKAGAIEQVEGNEEVLMAIARERHPELRALRARERAASAAVDAAIASLYPSLGIGGDYAGSGSQFPLTWNWAVMARSAVSLFTGWRETAKVDEAVAAMRAARSRVAEREQLIYLDIRRGLSSLNTACERQVLTDLIVREATESLALVNERYRQGKASAIEVTDAQVALTAARVARVRARFDRQKAVAQVQHAIGNGEP